MLIFWNRCLYASRKCLGYHVPRTWVFEGAKAKAKLEHPETHHSPDHASPDFSVGVMTPGPELSKDSVAQTDANLLATLDVCFGDTQEERRALNFWISETGPTLANYGADYGFWTDLIPLWAWQSPVVRHLLVATTLVDEELGFFRKAKFSQLSPQVIWHYQAAIKRMARAKQPNKFCLTLASVLAWVFETLQRNYGSAKIHVRAARKLLTELEASSAKLGQSTLDMTAQVKPLLDLAESYSKAMFDDDSPCPITLTENRVDDVTDVQSLESIRNEMLGSIARYLSKEQTDYDSWMQRLYVRHWHKVMRQYCSLSTKESRLYKKSIGILFNVGMAMVSVPAPFLKHRAFPDTAIENAGRVRHRLTEICSCQKAKPAPSAMRKTRTL